MATVDAPVRRQRSLAVWQSVAKHATVTVARPATGTATRPEPEPASASATGSGANPRPGDWDWIGDARSGFKGITRPKISGWPLA
jgi:hypothetical protein